MVAMRVCMYAGMSVFHGQTNGPIIVKICVRVDVTLCCDLVNFFFRNDRRHGRYFQNGRWQNKKSSDFDAIGSLAT